MRDARNGKRFVLKQVMTPDSTEAAASFRYVRAAVHPGEGAPDSPIQTSAG
jgi:hypothetical protein